MFSIVLAPIYSPTNSTQGFPFLHILTNTCYFFVILTTAILTGVVALVCFSLMVSDVEHLFVYLFAIWISSLEKMSI